MDRPDSIADWTVREWIERSTKPRFACGGGTAAAVTLAAAAALAQLVRRASRSHLEAEFAAAVSESLDDTMHQALELADLDRMSLQTLLATLRSSISQEHVAAASQRATEIPLRTGRLAVQLLETLERLARHVPPFAAADLEAAKALGQASARAALAMARANLPFLSQAAAESLRTKLEEIERSLQQGTA